MRQWRAQAQKQWSEIANKLGAFVEDIVAPSIPHVGQEIMGISGQPEELMTAPHLRLYRTMLTCGRATIKR